MDLVCTTRFDPGLRQFRWNDDDDGPSPYLLLPLQLDRLRDAARQCAWNIPLDYAALKSVCDTAVHSTDASTPLKIRVLVPPSGAITASATPVQPLSTDPTEASQFDPRDPHARFDPPLSICVDTQPTSGTSSIKTTHRKPYDDARARAGIPPAGTPLPSNHPDDVILFNPCGAIMETSICNVAFYRDGCWLTPPLSAGCISGVFRRWLLESGRICEADEGLLSLRTIRHNEWVLIFNGVMGCRLGRVRRDSAEMGNDE